MAASYKQIHLFDPVTYPRKLFVMKGKKAKKTIKEAFSNLDGDDLDVDDVDTDSVGACTWKSIRLRSTGKLGTLVWFVNDYSIKSAAHEAVHVVNGIFKECGVDMHYDHDEHYAYLLGWVVDCLWQTLTGNFKD